MHKIYVCTYIYCTHIHMDVYRRYYIIRLIHRHPNMCVFSSTSTSGISQIIRLIYIILYVYTQPTLSILDSILVTIPRRTCVPLGAGTGWWESVKNIKRSKETSQAIGDYRLPVAGIQRGLTWCARPRNEPRDNV